MQRSIYAAIKYKGKQSYSCVWRHEKAHFAMACHNTTRTWLIQCHLMGTSIKKHLEWGWVATFLKVETRTFKKRNNVANKHCDFTRHIYLCYLAPLVFTLSSSFKSIMAVENDRSRKAKKKKYLVSFNGEWVTKFNCVKKSRKGERLAFCSTCATVFGIGYGGENDIKKHIGTPKHKSNITSLKSSRSLTDWGSSTATNKLNEKVSRAELLFSVFITEHSLSIATADHARSLFRDVIRLKKCSKIQM